MREIINPQCGTYQKNDDCYDMQFHRGGRDARAENTLYSYQYAIENGAKTIECDMQMTSDSQIVMSHNPALNPDITTDRNGKRIDDRKRYIHDMTLKEVQSYNVGRMCEGTQYYEQHGKTQVKADAHIPSLREFFTLVRDSGDKDIQMSIEAKYYSDVKVGEDFYKNPDADTLLFEFLSLVREFGFESRVILQCFDWSLLIKMKELDKDIRTIALYMEDQKSRSPYSRTLWLDRKKASPWLAGVNIHDFDDDPIRAASYLGIDDVSPYCKNITKEQVDEAHRLNMRVVPWTVNDIKDMESLYNMGVDGIITDRPWMLRSFLQSKGETLRPVRKVDLPYHLEPNHIC